MTAIGTFEKIRDSPTPKRSKGGKEAFTVAHASEVFTDGDLSLLCIRYNWSGGGTHTRKLTSRTRKLVTTGTHFLNRCRDDGDGGNDRCLEK